MVLQMRITQRNRSKRPDMHQPEELFESFGPAVVAEIQRHLRRSGTLGPLLRSLGLDAPRLLEEQYGVLLQYLEACGSIDFLNQVSLVDPANTVAQRLRSGGTRPVIPPRSVPVKPPPSEIPIADEAINPMPPARDAPNVPEVLVDAGEWVTTPDYSGPERRLGVERRLGPSDRRHQLETIFKNQRYGGRDRRKTIRRKDDRVKLFEVEKKRNG